MDGGVEEIDRGWLKVKGINMRRFLTRSAAILALVLSVVWMSGMRKVDHSGSFLGPDFLSRSAAESDEVWSGFRHQLEWIGFTEEPAPEAEIKRRVRSDASGAGGEKNGHSRFMRLGRDGRIIGVEVDFSEISLRTRVSWQIHGREKDAHLAKREAAQVALALDEWLGARMETNLVPPEVREHKQRLYHDLLEPGRKGSKPTEPLR